MATRSVDEIPSISLLYHLKRLHPAEFEDNPEDAPTPSQSFNDKISIIRADITKLEVDAIVNAANNSLLGGGGVDGAIHRAAGPELFDECETLDGCDTGSAKITGAYELPCRKVIHAVGPVYNSGRKQTSASLLAGCYAKSLELAVENECKSIVFSALSTGVYGYPSQEAAPIAIKVVKDFLEGEDGHKIEKIVFCTFEQKDVNAYNEWIPKFFPPTEQDLTHEHEEDWEEVEKGDSAENGIPKEEPLSADASEPQQSDLERSEIGENEGKTVVEDLPDVPQNDPEDTVAEEQTSEVDTSQDKSAAAENPAVKDLPEVPTDDPKDEPAAKKQKTDNDDEGVEKP